MSPPIYIVTVDFDDDLTADSGEDITADVLHLEWRLGFESPYQSVAAPVTARVTIRNPTRAYSPEVTANPYTPGKRLCIQSDDGLTVRTHFTGFITHVEPTPGDQGERLAVIHVAGPEAQLVAGRARLPPQVNQRADQVINAIIDALFLRRPALAGYWLLGVVNHSELNTNTHLAEDYPRSLETGQSVFAYIADTWAGGIPALDAIAQVAEAERGRFFVDRDGALVFHNRHHTLLTADSLTNFSDDIEAMQYDYGADLANRISVTLLPRRIGSSNTTLWTLENPQRLIPGEVGVRTVIARYRDANERPVGALHVISPIAGIDYHANTQPNGAGQDRTSQVAVLLTEAGAGAATLTLRNNGADAVYLLPGMTVRGTPIIQGDAITLEQTDWTSVSLHGLHTFSLNLPALDSLEEADQLARFELARRTNPRGIVRGIQVSGTSHLTQMLERTLFDRITIAETQTGHTGDYFIIAEAHTVDLGGERHVASWLLEPAAASTFWIIGTSLLDQDTILGY